MHCQMIIVNVCEDDMVEGEMLGEKEFSVFVEDIDRNCERWSIWDKSIHFLVRWPIISWWTMRVRF